MSDGSVVVKDPKDSTKVNSFYFQKEVLNPISPKEGVVYFCLRTEDQNNRQISFTHPETGDVKVTKLPPRSVVHVPGGVELIAKAGSKAAGLFPPENEFFIAEIKVDARNYDGRTSIKHYLLSWRAIEDIRDIVNAKLTGIPLRFSQQLVSSVTVGYDFDIVQAEGD